MKLQSKKLIEWTRQDYTRTVAWFALHTAIFILGFFAILYVNAGFNWGALVTFIQGEGAVKNLIYLVKITIGNLYLLVQILIPILKQAKLELEEPMLPIIKSLEKVLKMHMFLLGMLHIV